MKQAALLTYGCQMNKYDSEVISGILTENSFAMTDDISHADVILLNTCSIREKAEQKVFSQIGRLRPLKEKNPGLIIGVGGCVGQLQGEQILKKAPLVDLVFGTSNAYRLPELIEQIEESGVRIADVEEEVARSEFSAHIKREGTVHAWVSILRGCSNYCTYCVVPYARGEEKSRNPGDILSEICHLIEKGYKEVTLLGQNVNSYGNDLGKETDFPALLEQVNSVKGLERIRFVTSHPRDFTDRLIDAMASLEKVCESLHLPVQAGSDRVLEKMNRGYGISGYMDKLERVRGRIKNLSVTTDIIVRFPGESEADFFKTRDLVKSTRFDSLFLFKYSKRPETPAASYEDQVMDREKQKRFEEILELQKGISTEINRSYEGKKMEVLVEGKSRTDSGKMTGRTRMNKIVNFSFSVQPQVGSLVQVNILRGKVYGLEGTYYG